MLSTLLELAGFALLSLAAFSFNTKAGYIVTALALIFIGLSVEDGNAVVLLQRYRTNVTAWRARRAIKKEHKKTATADAKVS